VGDEWFDYEHVFAGRVKKPGDKPVGLTHPWFSNILVKPKAEGELSFHALKLPFFTDGDLNCSLLLEMILNYVKILKPAHGLAGVTAITGDGMDVIHDSPYVYPYFMRHPGIDYHDPVTFSVLAEQEHNRIKSVNWLTVLGDEVLNELGGPDTARRELEPECTVHTYEGGVVIQAGAYPQFGDTEENDIPAAYRKVARFTRPVRFGHYEHGSLMRVPDHLAPRTETERWLARFD